MVERHPQARTVLFEHVPGTCIAVGVGPNPGGVFVFALAAPSHSMTVLVKHGPFAREEKRLTGHFSCAVLSHVLTHK
jgi:hypothetical protein